MKTELALIIGGITGGMLSNGVNTILPEKAQDNALTHVVLAGASGFAYTKVKGTDSKDNMLRGALMGMTITEGIKAIRLVSNKSLDGKLTATNKTTAFTRGFLGLAGAEEELYALNGGCENAYLQGADGELYTYDETGLAGTYMDEAGQVFEDGLNAPEDLYDEVASLNAPEDLYDGMASLNGVDDDLYEV